MTHGTTPSTVIWCGTVKQCLTDVEKAILFHKHEANRSRFFGMMKQEEYHTWMADSITRMQEYSNRTNDKFKDALVKSWGTEGVAVVGSNREERIKHMTQIFKGMDK